MKIAIDIDDTLTDSYDYFQPHVAQFFGKDPSLLKARRISYANIPPEWGKEVDFAHAFYDRLVPSTPFKAGAAEGMKALKAWGHELVIITGRTKDFYLDPYATTREELQRGGIVYDKLICTLEKADACRREGITLLVDDMPHNCRRAEEVGVSALLFASPMNQGNRQGLQAVTSWPDLLEQIRTGNFQPFPGHRRCGRELG